MSSQAASSSAGDGPRRFGDRKWSAGYERYAFRETRAGVLAQILVIPGPSLKMSVKAADDALGIDFRTQVTRPDLRGNYCDRPGFYLHEVLSDLRAKDRCAIVFNGNNVGYWGNQFVIERGRLRYKSKGPIFDDGRLAEHVSGKYAFFLGSNGFRVANLTLLASRASDSAVDVEVVSGSRPRYGLSGMPVLMSGRPVWREFGELAWDPGLLFDVGPLSGDRYGDIRAVVRQLLDEGEELARHPMTVIGVDAERNVVLLVVERSERSRGMTVAEAAELLRRHYKVRDAIVLGAAGDAQLATTQEGFLTTPLVAPYARRAARAVPPEFLSREVAHCEVYARPVPCYVRLELRPA